MSNSVRCIVPLSNVHVYVAAVMRGVRSRPGSKGLAYYAALLPIMQCSHTAAGRCAASGLARTLTCTCTNHVGQHTHTRQSSAVAQAARHGWAACEPMRLNECLA